MMQFRVTARNKEGVSTSVLREAESRSALLVELRAEGLVVLSIAEEKTTTNLPSAWNPSWLIPMRSFDVEMGLRQLAAMLRSGMALLGSLKTVREQALCPRAMRTWMRVEDDVYHGKSFADALKNRGRRFDEVVVRLVEVGEKSGELEFVVMRAADQLEARRNLRTQVINALVYPILAVSMAVGVSVYLVVAVIPKIAEFLQSGGAELPEITQTLLDVSAWVNANYIAVLGGLAAAVFAWVVVRMNALGHEAEDVFLLKLPVVGGILRLSGTALFSRSMQVMLDSGVTLVDSLTSAGLLMKNLRFRRRVMVAHDKVISGSTMSDSLSSANEFMPMLRRMVTVGEVSGTLGEVLGETARFHEMMLAIAIRRFGMMIEPVMLCVTGVIVGFVYIAFFVALFSIAGTA